MVGREYWKPMVTVVQWAQLFVQRARVEEGNNDDEHDDHEPNDVDDKKSGGWLGLVEVTVPCGSCRVGNPNQHEGGYYNQAWDPDEDYAEEDTAVVAGVCCAQLEIIEATGLADEDRKNVNDSDHVKDRIGEGHADTVLFVESFQLDGAWRCVEDYVLARVRVVEALGLDVNAVGIEVRVGEADQINDDLMENERECNIVVFGHCSLLMPWWWWWYWVGSFEKWLFSVVLPASEEYLVRELLDDEDYQDDEVDNDARVDDPVEEAWVWGELGTREAVRGCWRVGEYEVIHWLELLGLLGIGWTVFGLCAAVQFGVDFLVKRGDKFWCHDSWLDVIHIYITYKFINQSPSIKQIYMNWMNVKSDILFR